MKNTILLSTLVLLASCNGGAGGAGAKALSGDTNTSGGSTGSNNSGSNNSGSSSNTNALTMQEVINYINNSNDTFTYQEKIHDVDVVSHGRMERGTATLKCLKAGSKKIRYTKDGKDYTSHNIPLCVIQNMQEVRTVFQGIPELNVFYRAGEVDYLVTPDTLAKKKFHYAAQDAGCTLSGPITDLNDLSPVVNTCLNNLLLTTSNFERNSLPENRLTIVSENYDRRVPEPTVNDNDLTGTIDKGNYYSATFYVHPISANFSSSVLGSANFDSTKLAMNSSIIVDSNLSGTGIINNSFTYDGNLVRIGTNFGCYGASQFYKYSPLNIDADDNSSDDQSNSFYNGVCTDQNQFVISDLHKITLNSDGKPVVVTEEEKSLIPHMAEIIGNISGNYKIGDDYRLEYDDQR